MNTTHKSVPSAEGQKILKALNNAVNRALDKKRKLGQYAVTWDGSKPVATGQDAPVNL